MGAVTVSTAAEQEAERRWPETEPAYLNRGMVSHDIRDRRDAFEDGAEWALEPYRELLEAAREYRDADRAQDEMRFTAAWMSLRAAAAALNEEGGD